MVKGTPSFGKHRKIIHIRCRRCGHNTYHIRHKKCSNCGYPSKRLRNFRWMQKHPLTDKRKK